MRWSNFCFFTQTKKDSWTDDKLLMMKILHIIAKNDYAIFHQKRDFKLNKNAHNGTYELYHLYKMDRKVFFLYSTQIIRKNKFFKGVTVKGFAFFKPAGVPSSLYNSSWFCLDGRTILTFSPGITSKLSVSLLYTTPPFCIANKKINIKIFINYRYVRSKTYMYMILTNLKEISKLEIEESEWERERKRERWPTKQARNIMSRGL